MTGPPTDRAERAFERAVRTVQRDERVPAVQAAVYRADRPLWMLQVGGDGRGSQFRIGSVTKTFTSVLVMQCRDQGLLDLDDPLSAHLDLPAHGDLTIRRLLSHTAGLQREPFGDVWDTLVTPDAEQLVADLVRVERVLPPARRWHYSNLGFSLLGLLVGRLRGATWAEVLLDRVLHPLALDDTSTRPRDPAVGYLVDAYSDHARAEPAMDEGGTAPAGQLWSTAPDMARWAAFLADPARVDPDAAVLSADTLEEMRQPLTVTDPDEWAAGFGLGLILVPQPGRVVHVGHDGAMPGFLAGVYGRRGPDTPPALSAAVLGSSGTAGKLVELPHTLLAKAVELDPADIEPWTPGPAAPEEYRSLLGPWWSEGFAFTFRWVNGRLEATREPSPPGRPPSVFAPEGPDLLRTVSGREAGELLRLTRDGSGRVVRMHWATYRFTRGQETFDGIVVSEP